MPQIGKQAMDKGQNIVQNPVTKEMATEHINQIIQETGMPPAILVKMGKLAENAIRNPKEYDKFVDFMANNKAEKREAMKKPDYQMLASLVMVGKVAEGYAGNQQPIKPIEPTQGL
jgi:hypothetical protein